MRFTVIGASGYLGGRIAQYLKQQGHEVVGVYRTPPVDPLGVLDSLDETLQGDLIDTGFIHKVAACEPEVLVYTVSLNHHDSETDYRESININLAPLMELGRKLAEQNFFKRLIYFSTLQVYGTIQLGQTVDESTLINPKNMYGLTHAFCEQGLNYLKRTHRLDSVSLRLSNGYGAPAFPSCDCWWLVINDFCRSTHNDGKIQLKSDGTPQRDFIHVEDIARAVEFLAKTEQELPSILNLASGDTLTMLELAHITASVFEKRNGKTMSVFLPGKIKSLSSYEHRHNKKFIITSDKLTNLGFEKIKTIEDGINEVINYLESE